MSKQKKIARQARRIKELENAVESLNGLIDLNRSITRKASEIVKIANNVQPNISALLEPRELDFSPTMSAPNQVRIRGFGHELEVIDMIKLTSSLKELNDCLHMKARLGDAVCEYRISKPAIYKMPEWYLSEMVSEQLSKQLIKALKNEHKPTTR